MVAGRLYLSPPLSERAIASYIENAEAILSDDYESLTDRERQVLHLVAEGQNNRSIAIRLSISLRTVETHRTNMMRKLGLHTQAELVDYASQRGILLSSEDSFPAS